MQAEALIAPLLFCLVDSFLRQVEQIIDIGAVARKTGDTDRNAQVLAWLAFGSIAEAYLFKTQTKLVSHGQARHLICFGQQNDEFITAKAGDQIDSTSTLTEKAGGSFQDDVPFHFSMPIIICFEMIDIDQQDTEMVVISS